MKPITIGWDSPAGAVIDHYAVECTGPGPNRIAFTTAGLEAAFEFAIEGAYHFEVRAIAAGGVSAPALLDHWFEEFTVSHERHGDQIYVIWDTVAARRYALEQSIDQLKTWQQIGDYIADNTLMIVTVPYVPAVPSVSFRVWSCPPEVTP